MTFAAFKSVALSKTLAAALLAFGALGASIGDAAADSGRYGHAYARCEAHAFTILGGRIDGAGAIGDGRDFRRACGEAIGRCEHRLDNVRRRTGVGFPLAECRVTARHGGDRYDDRRHGYRDHDRRGYGRTEIRCEAQAERRNGQLVHGARGVESRRDRRAACSAALYECEAKLDRERRRTGRPMPHAQCVVTGASRI